MGESGGVAMRRRAKQTTSRTGGTSATRGLLILASSTFIAVTTEVMPIGLLPAISTDLGILEGRAGMLVSVYAFLVMLLAVPLTSALRRIPGKHLLIAAMLGYTLANLLFALAPSFAMLAAGRILGGATHAVFFSVCIGYSTRLVDPARTGRALALVSAGSSAGLVAGSPLATAIGNVLGWRAAALVLALASALVLLLIARYLPDVRQRAAAPPAAADAAPLAAMRDASSVPGPAPAAGPASQPSLPRTDGGAGRRRRAAMIVVSANALVYLAQFVLYTYVAVLLLGAGASEQLVAPALFAFGILGVVVIAITAPHLDRRPAATAIVLFALVGGSMLAIAAAPRLLPLVLVLGVVWNAAFGPVSSLFQSATVRTGAFSPEVAGAWVNMTSNIGIAVGSLIGGLLIDATGAGVLALVSGSIMILALVLVVLGRRAFAIAPLAQAEPAL